MGGLLLACDPSAMDGLDDDAGGGEDGTIAERRCPPPEGVNARPESIEEVVTLLRALPEPITLPCFLESLERPLTIAATTHAFSAQPADGEGSPRMFIQSGPLTMSVVPVGIGESLLEMAVDVGNRESLKAELTFPLNIAPEPADPYLHIEQPGGGSTCNGCHVGERESEEVTIATAFISEALQPPEDTMVSIAFVQQLASTCDPETEARRCEMLDAIFEHGEIQSGAFPPDLRICRTP